MLESKSEQAAYKRVVFPGRFQPLHKGHMHAIRWLLGHVGEIIVVVGSAEKSHTLENPFTAGERILMLRETIAAEKLPLERIIIVPVPDIEYNSLWVGYLETLLPPFQAVASRNPLVQRLFAEKGYAVLEPPLYQRDLISGVRIRKMMLEGRGWEDLVPKRVVEIVREISGIERIRKVVQTDEEL
uniref:Nicotinamide-nucleotide adenylyltransferase n=1 Tax=Fervidicoccus fontis TaxID=683846 RepID=A0A7J3ZN90_9CREN